MTHKAILGGLSLVLLACTAEQNLGNSMQRDVDVLDAGATDSTSVDSAAPADTSNDVQREPSQVEVSVDADLDVGIKHIMLTAREFPGDIGLDAADEACTQAGRDIGRQNEIWRAFLVPRTGHPSDRMSNASRYLNLSGETLFAAGRSGLRGTPEVFWRQRLSDQNGIRFPNNSSDASFYWSGLDRDGRIDLLHACADRAGIPWNSRAATDEGTVGSAFDYGSWFFSDTRSCDERERLLCVQQ